MSIRQKNIVLIGFMGSGKTTLSHLLAKRLNFKRVSIDERIAQQEGKAITAIFKDQGEAYFRSREAAIVKELAAQEGLIIDGGGGIVLNPDNIHALKQNGLIVFLDVSAATVYERLLKDSSRPLLQGPNPLRTITELLSQRLPLYQQAADLIVDANDPSFDKPLVEILAKV